MVKSLMMVEHSVKDGRKTLAHFISQLPRKDGAEREFYLATMLILLKPWRTKDNLLRGHATWKAAFDATEFDEASMRLMKTFNVLYECLDSRDDYALQ
jgi:hypothetical protein